MTITHERQPHHTGWQTHWGRHPRLCPGFFKRVWDIYWKYAGALSNAADIRKVDMGACSRYRLFLMDDIRRKPYMSKPRSGLRMLHCVGQREFTHKLDCYFWFLFGESQTPRKSGAFSRWPGRRRGVCSHIGVSFSVVRNQEEERKNARFPRQKNIKGYAAFCCGKYLELL